ncbi:MAG: hypothetical protein ABW065_13815 [Solirubrobacterales bacterium]
MSWLTSVGIPQGILGDPEGEDETGVVRRGGEFVSLDSADYELWLFLLVPLPLATIVETAARREWLHPEATTKRLLERGLLVEIGPGEALGPGLDQLRPLPLGIGIGNTPSAPKEFRLQSADRSLPRPVVLDPIGVMLWWECDGASPLGEISSRVAARCPQLPPAALDQVTVGFARDLMANRLLYLDSPPRGSAAGG